ncbi:MAG: PQQ-binding-like beta-propeller repeat protein [Bryobacteraceae bacterium]
MKSANISALLLLVFLLVPGSGRGDWTDWRGPRRDGVSHEKNLPTNWSLVWKAPYGGRSTPIVLGDRVFLQSISGTGETLQERVMCFNADTGKLLWEHKVNIYLSDVPPHRVGWASPVADPKTGNIYIYTVGGSLLGLTKEGKPLWERSLSEDFGLVTTHGGRTVSPIIEGDLVIISGVNAGWGNQARAAHRFMAFDKKTGETQWVGAPGARPFDTTYSPPIASVIDGMRMIIAGGGDGTVHALKAQTGESVWRYTISKRGVNTGIALNGTTAIVSHSEENLDTSEMGLLAAIDATAKGEIGKEQIKWRITGFQGGFSSPVIDGDRLYQIDNGANLYAFDVVSGKRLWQLNLGVVQKASPVLADGKLYAGSENGKFYILRPRADRCEILHEQLLGSEATPEAITASVAISDGRIYVVSDSALYCIGKKNPAPPLPAERMPDPPPANAAVAHVQVVPTELTLKPGDNVSFRARLFDDKGRFLRETKAAWAVEKLQGAVSADGRYTAAGKAGQAGLVKATVDGATGMARVRVIPPLPWSENFDSVPPDTVPSHWINATGKSVVREVEGNKVLVKLSDNPFTRRARVYLGPSDLSNYTVEADVLATEKRRQMGDAGVVAQRYALILFGNHQRLELQPWQPETSRTATVKYPWKANTWYRMKLRVEPAPGGKVAARGKVWPAAEAEPGAWTIERVDPIPNLQGSPGVYADAPFEVYIDNLKVTPNQ